MNTNSTSITHENIIIIVKLLVIKVAETLYKLNKYAYV